MEQKLALSLLLVYIHGCIRNKWITSRRVAQSRAEIEEEQPSAERMLNRSDPVHHGSTSKPEKSGKRRELAVHWLDGELNWMYCTAEEEEYLLRRHRLGGDREQGEDQLLLDLGRLHLWSPQRAGDEGKKQQVLWIRGDFTCGRRRSPERSRKWSVVIVSCRVSIRLHIHSAVPFTISTYVSSLKPSWKHY